MKNIIYLIFLPLCIFMESACTRSATEIEISIIPRPVALERTTGNFTISKSTTIMVESQDPESIRVANMLAERLKIAGDISLEVVETEEYAPRKNVILFTTVDAVNMIANSHKNFLV